MAENAGKWESASRARSERIDAVARAIVNRLLHDPTLHMKEMRDDRVHARMALVRELFGLSVGEDALAETPGAAQPAATEPEPPLANVRARGPAPAAAPGIDAARHARQRARADPGALGGGAARAEVRDRPDHDAR